MLHISTSSGRTYSVRPQSKPCPILLHRMVAASKGVATIIHKDGVLTLRAEDITATHFEDESAGAPWNYDDPLN